MIFMMKSWTNLFLELIRVAVGRQDALSRGPSEEEWLRIYDMACEQTVDAVCFSGIERLPRGQRPPQELLLQWYGVTKQTEYNNRVVDERCQQALQFFKKAGFHPTILKGLGMARLYDANLNGLGQRRQSGDIDVWLDGGRERVYQFAKQHDPEGKLHGVNYHHVHFHLFDDMEVEAHIYPGYLCNPYANRRLQQFFKAHPSERMGDYPDRAFNIVFILLHCFSHLTGHGVGLRQVMDYYFVLRTEVGQKTDEGALRGVLKELGMLRFARGLMWVMQEVFGLEREYVYVEPDEKEGRFILNEIFQTGNMGHHDKRHWGSLRTPLSRYIYNLRRDWHFLSHYPHEVLWKPFFSLWLFFHQKFVWK